MRPQDAVVYSAHVRDHCIPLLLLTLKLEPKKPRLRGKCSAEMNGPTFRPQAVPSKVNRKLHLQHQNSISIIRQLIESNFKDFKTYNDFSPVVTTKQNFDDLYIPKDHPSCTRSDDCYFNRTMCFLLIHPLINCIVD
ncbi:hypothetical protein FB192DRAFT_1065563 [Mucor lusitanicus]|uniref:Phenylalanine--tRNA ligase n=1 Tax=Mucor circinelloides f. lusitanicus TaxID=29924 RepID=A0A8H4BQQ7_MUCCL|nr:hypothetical protein FB192DRAFT_1065563 [Mucor lusitanicus]